MADHNSREKLNKGIDQSEDLREHTNGRPLNIMYIIDDIWKGFKKFFWIIPVLVLICSGGNYYLSRNSYRPTYQAFASFAINTRTAYGYTDTYYNKTVASQMAKTFPYILTPITGAVIYSSANFYWGGSAEEFLFPFIMWGMYLSLRYFREVYPRVMPYKVVLIGGILAGCVLNIKFN